MDTHTLRARLVFPVTGPPIDGGYLAIAHGRFVEVGRAIDATAVDLGDVALVPALVNAHTHLELSDLVDPLAADGTFADWIRGVLRWRATRGESESAAAATIDTGLREATRAGTVAVGDIATSDAWPHQRDHVPISGWRFLELIGLAADRVKAQKVRAEAFMARSAARGFRFGLSPHAPYSAALELVQYAAQLANRHQSIVAMHLAESREELQLLSSHDGPLRELLDELGVWQPRAIPRGSCPLDYLQLLAQAPRALVIHGNYLAANEREFLADNADRMSLVYCPRTHAYFGHAPYGLHQLLTSGVHVALGTDSRASSPNLSMWDDLRLAHTLHPDVAPAELLRLGTRCGAEALDLATELGSLEPGKRAALVAVRIPSRSSADPHELLFDDSAQIDHVRFDGVPYWR